MPDELETLEMKEKRAKQIARNRELGQRRQKISEVLGFWGEVAEKAPAFFSEKQITGVHHLVAPRLKNSQELALEEN